MIVREINMHQGNSEMEAAEPFKVVGLGELIWEAQPGGDTLRGSAANLVYYAKSLGARGTVVSAVGRDAQGNDLIAQLRALDLSTDYITLDPARPTAVQSALFRQQEAATPSGAEGVAWDHIPFREESVDLVQRSNAICFGTLATRNIDSRATVRKLLESALPGCLRLFDVNLRPPFYTRDSLEQLLEYTDVLKLNEDELPVITDLLHIPGSMKERMEALLNLFALDAVALTRGARGSVILTPGLLEVHHGVRIDERVDTAGAGDAFTAMLALGLLDGWPLSEISYRANQLAAYVCTQAGARATRLEDITATL